MVARTQTTDSVIDSPKAWARLAVCMLLGTIGSVGMWAIVVVMPAVQAEFGVDRGDASLPYTTTMIGYALGNVVIGRFVDRLGIALPIAIAGVTLGCGFVLAGLAPGIWLFAAAQGALIGIGTAATFGPMVADLSHWFVRRRGIAMAAAATGNYLAGVVWPPIIEMVMAGHSWRTAYVGIGVFAALTMLPLAMLLRTRHPPEPLPLAGQPRSRHEPKQIALSPRALQMLLALAGVGCCVAMSMPQVQIVSYCSGLGYGVAHGAQMLSLMLGAGIVSRLVSGAVADRIGGVRTLLIGSICQCLSLALYIPFDGLTSLYLVSLVFGLSQGGIVPCYAIIVREYLPAREAGRRVGVVIMATIFGMALGGWLSGWIFDQTGSYTAAFVNGIVWNLMNISVILAVLSRTGRSPLAAAA